MKHFLTLTLVAFFSFFLFISGHAQDFSNAGNYMSYISTQQIDISKKFLSYNSAVSHGKRASKVEGLHNKLLDEVQTAKENINSMPSFEGDKEYRDSAVSFMTLYYNIMNNDLSKIVNLQEIAEQSYSDMEALLLAKQMVNKKMKDADAQLYGVQVKFAKTHNVNLINTKNEISEKMDIVDQVCNYYDPIYLIFFKSYLQEKYLLDAIQKMNVNGIEQNRNSLLQNAQIGLTQLDTMKSFKDDNSLVQNGKALLQFYIKECNENIGSMSDYFVKAQDFDKTKTAFEQNSSHSKDDVNNYNKQVQDVNRASNNYNNMNNMLNAKRSDVLDRWNKGVDTYFDNQMPSY